MNQICLTPTFEKSLSKLSNREQSLVKQVPTEFMLDPQMPGHRLHKLNFKESRFWSISVSMDLRIIVLRDKGRIHFCYVGHHDDAYGWAQRRRLEVHPTTGAAQLVELEEVIREEVIYVSREVAEPPLFASEDDSYLLALGVPKSWLETVKQLDTNGLFNVAERLPEEATEALLSLATGTRPQPAQYKSADQSVVEADPFEHPDAQRRFWVASDERALRRALDYSWERWIVFLHPSQRAAVERNFGGPARVSGGAGTGKTVVALHRAVHLAEKSSDALVLLTTYSRPLVAHLNAGLDHLVGATGDTRRRIRVEHLHKLAFDIAKDQAAFAFAPVQPRELNEFFDNAIQDNPDVEISKAFLRAEFDAVIDYWGVKQWDQYRKIQRTGRGSALSAGRREQYWPIFQSVLDQMRSAGRMSWADLADAGRHSIEAQGKPPFHHVVADEAQDFGPRELQLLMSLAPAGSYSHFFTGDVGQRIYRYPFSWLRAGVDIRGRSARLFVNYRTTHQIKNFADTALGDLEPNEDEEVEDRRSLSLLSGPDPVVAGASNVENEIDDLSEWLKAIVDQGIGPAEIAVFARTNRLLEDRIAPAIEKAGLAVVLLSSNHTASAEEAVSVGTLHSAKGLEFRAVALVGCDDDILPHPSALAAADDAEGRAVAEARERQLFYVGCTRAREALRISCTGTPSRFMDKTTGANSSS